MTTTLDAAQLLATFTRLGIDAEAIVAAQFDFVGGSLDDGYNAAGGLTGARGYYPLTNADGQTVYFPCYKRIQVLSVGGGDPAVLENILGVQVQAATSQANNAAAKAAQAVMSATDAAASKGAAQAAATTATTKAGEASASATAAATSAGSVFSAAGTATTKAGEASTSAASALASKTAAETAANTATARAGEAVTSATGASNSAATATGAAATATAKANDASSSAATATAKAGEAATSAASIVGAVTQSQTAAGTATSKAADALASANTASTAAGTATTKAAEATTGAATATSKAADAAASAASAADSKTSALSSKNDAQTAVASIGSSVSDALGYRNAAQSAASTATTKAGEASTSASSAMGYRDQAQQAASQAQAATGGALLIGNDLSDLHDKAQARSNLGLGSLATQSGTFSGSSSGDNSGDQLITLTGDVTGSGKGSFPATIAVRSVTFGKLVAATGAAILGATAAGDYGPLTAANARSVMGLGSAATLTAGAASGNVPVLDGNGKLVSTVIPSVAISDVFTVASQAAMLALTAERGDVAIRTDLSKAFILSTDSPGTLADWKELLTPADVVQSVAGLNGTITAAALRSALTLVVGTDVQAYDADLQAIASLTTTTYGRSFLTFNNAAEARTALALGSIATFAEATAAEYRAAAASRALSAAKVWEAAQPVTLVDAATIPVDLSAMINGKVTLLGNRTLGAPTNGKPGQSGRIEIFQDGTGSRTLAYASAWGFGGTAPTLSTAAGARDVLRFEVLSDGKIDAYLSKGR